MSQQQRTAEEPRINADGRGLIHEELTSRVIGLFYEVYNELGFGFLESVYEEAMARVMIAAGLKVDRQRILEVRFRGDVIGVFRADLLVNDVVVVEIKAVRAWDPCHEAQLLNYLRATNLEVGLLFNFAPKPAFKRLVYANARK